MPKQKEQYEDTLGSIFDFIYSESQKSPKKVKPMKVTGIDGTSEIADALVATLENPLLFVSDNTMESFKEALDIDMAKFSLNDRGLGVGFNLQDIGAIVRDPKKYIDKAFGKMEGIRKMGRAAHAGEAMRSVLGGMWARKAGLDWDTQKAMMAAGNMSQSYTDSGAKAGRSPGFSMDMMSRNEELMEKHFVAGTRKIDKQFLIEKHGADRGGQLYAKYNNARTKYLAGNLADEDGLYLYADKELYAMLEAEEIQYKANTSANQTEKSKYEAAANFIDHMSVTNDLKNFNKRGKKEINDKLSLIASLKGTPGSSSQISKLKGEIRGIRSDLNMARAYEIAGEVGVWEGRINSAKDLFNGNLLPNIINGKFFEDKYNSITWLQPSKKEKIINRGKEMECHMGKLNPKGSKLSNNYNESMNALYYLSPATWIKSLATGESFTYVAKMAQRKFEKEMNVLLTNSVPNFNMQTFLQDIMDGNGSTAINGLGTISQTNLRKINKFAKKYKRFGDLGYRFGTLGRLKDGINDYFEKKIFKAVRLKVGAALLRVGFVSQFSRHAVTLWMKNGGMYTLLRGVTTAALQAIGFTVAGPVGNFIVTVVSSFVTDVLLKAAKPLLKFGLEIILILFVGIISLLFFSGAWFMSIFGQYSHVSPQQVVQCGAFAGTDYIIDDPDNPGGVTPGGPMEEFVAGALPSGEECLLGEASYSCTQGAYGSYSHQNVAAIDVGGVSYFHAPAFCGNGGTCKVTYVGDVNCRAGYAGGMVKFTAEYKGQTYEFKLIHVDTSIGNGQALSSGQRVARVMSHAETTSACSSGKHLHMSTTLNGATVNPYDVMTKPVSEGGFGCGISACR